MTISTSAMRPSVLVYLAGPITARDGYSIEENVTIGFKAFLECLRRGIPAICPQMTGAFPTAFTVPHARWLEYDFEVIRRCTHVVLLPRWDTSSGARAEKAFAERIGIPVVDWHDLGSI